MSEKYSAILATDADETITVSDAAGELTLPAYFSQTGGIGGRCIILVRTAPILWTKNGTAPTAADESTGDKLNIGDRLILDTLVEMRNLKMRRATGTSGAVFVTYEKKVN